MAGFFYDPLPDPMEPPQPYEGLTLEKAIPILIRMIESNYRLIQEKSLWYQVKHLKFLQSVRKFWKN